MGELLPMLRRWLPPGNHLPGSLHLLRGMLGVQKAELCEYRACSCGRHYWPPCPRQQWSSEQSECCPLCNAPRFTAVRGGSQLAPTGQVGHTGTWWSGAVNMPCIS